MVKLSVISQLLLTLVKLIYQPQKRTLVIDQQIKVRSDDGHVTVRRRSKSQKISDKSLILVHSKLVKRYDFIFPSRHFIIKHERVRKVS